MAPGVWSLGEMKVGAHRVALQATDVRKLSEARRALSGLIGCGEQNAYFICLFHWHDFASLLAQFIGQSRTSEGSIRTGLKSRIPSAQNSRRPLDRERRVNPVG
jgi:hypothetical protein